MKPSLKVLVVEDVQGVREAFAEGIKIFFAGADVDEAIDGLDAQKKIEHSQYHVIISDLEMPRVQGDELLMWLRSHPSHFDVPFIMVTSHAGEDQQSRVLSLGASAYVTKPLTLRQLSHHIAKVLPEEFAP
jgi:two-component system chemotaxis response regulator CheY